VLISFSFISRGSVFVLISSTALASTVQSALTTGSYAYVTNWGSNNISVIDTATNNVTDEVDLSIRYYPGEIAVTPDGKKVYVTNVTNSGSIYSRGNTVFVIDTATNNVIATVKVGTDPEGVAVNPSGTRYM
jgi:YVTN family beta-propeller protein